VLCAEFEAEAAQQPTDVHDGIPSPGSIKPAAASCLVTESLDIARQVRGRVRARLADLCRHRHATLYVVARPCDMLHDNAQHLTPSRQVRFGSLSTGSLTWFWLPVLVRFCSEAPNWQVVVRLVYEYTPQSLMPDPRNATSASFFFSTSKTRARCDQSSFC
jgi:hypothetical protein